jgi:hypothetical protein
MAKEAVNKDKAMASHLKAIGYPHGRRMTVTHAPPDPMGHKHLGSAAQRRISAKKGELSSLNARTKRQDRRGS